MRPAPGFYTQASTNSESISDSISTKVDLDMERQNPPRRRRYDSEDEEPPRSREQYSSRPRSRSRSRERRDHADSRRYPNENGRARERVHGSDYNRDRASDSLRGGIDRRLLSQDRDRSAPPPARAERDHQLRNEERPQLPPPAATGSNRMPLGGGPAPPAGYPTDGPPLKPEYMGPKELPNFGLSGALAKDAVSGNTRSGVVMKWSEPIEAAVPKTKWLLFVFKDGVELPSPESPLHVHRQSAYLFGRDPAIADITCAHPSVSGQHAVLQFRRVPQASEAGDMGPPRTVVKPYILDLGSTNLSYLNGQALPPARYVECRPQDLIKFGSSSREYVLLHE